VVSETLAWVGNVDGELSPDEAVQAAIATVFDRFAELGSARQVLLSLRADGLRLPRRTAGSRLIRWAEATYPAVHDFLTNPAYSGAYVFGRRKTTRRVDQSGQIVAHERELPRDEWEVTIPDHHPGYLSWQDYQANQDRLRANSRPARGQGGGAVREGAALLQGLVVCGRCGRRMLVSYSGVGGRVTRYVCAQGLRLYGSTRTCQSLSGHRLDTAVVEQMFTVLQPAALAATAAALVEAKDQHARRLRAFELAVERAQYDAERARRQFEAVEPENRLVARTLERDWEARLATLGQAETELAAQRSRRPCTLTEEEVAWLSRAGADLRAVFDATSTTIRERKQLLRLLIGELVVTIDSPGDGQPRHADVTIAWEGGARTPITVALPGRGVDGPIRTEADTLERLRRLAVHYDDATIARLLARQGLLTATGLPFTADRVGSLRRKHAIDGPAETVRPAVAVLVEMHRRAQNAFPHALPGTLALVDRHPHPVPAGWGHPVATMGETGATGWPHRTGPEEAGDHAADEGGRGWPRRARTAAASAAGSRWPPPRLAGVDRAGGGQRYRGRTVAPRWASAAHPRPDRGGHHRLRTSPAPCQHHGAAREHLLRRAGPQSRHPDLGQGQ
jgi:hypothetical protein